VKKRSGEPWMPADEFGRDLNGFSVNLLVRDVGQAASFQADVLGMEVFYADADFALVRGVGAQWMLHADHTYQDHPMHGIAINAEGRGAGLELRLYGLDPDAIEQRAREQGYTVLESCTDKPHGMRECFLIDDDGYVWVPSCPI